MNTGELIEYLRKKKGMSQEQLGKVIGVQKNAVSKIEKGRTGDIAVSRVKILAKLFGVRPAVFVEDDVIIDADGSVKIRDEIEKETAIELPKEVVEAIKKSALSSESEFTEFEIKLVMAYRALPDMQIAVDYLLGIMREHNWYNGGTKEDFAKMKGEVDFRRDALIARYRNGY